MNSKFYPAIIFALLIFSCQEEKQQHEGATKTATYEDSLYKTVIGYHDEVMPKMGKLAGYQKAVQVKIDSLDKALVNQKNEVGHDLKSSYETLLNQLKAAENGMNDWMDSFEPDPKLESPDELRKFWEAELIKTKKMRDDFKDALDSAEKKLNY